jgi:hypothetical protein
MAIVDIDAQSKQVSAGGGVALLQNSLVSARAAAVHPQVRRPEMTLMGI